MEQEMSQAYYWSGIGVIAWKFGVRVERLSMGDRHGLDAKAEIEPLEDWCQSYDGQNPFHIAKVEDYVTTLLAGSAACFIRAEDRRCHLKTSFGNAGLEMRFLRQVWQCLQPEPDRAVALIVGFLGHCDDGDVEATTRRLWHRATRILRQPSYYGQLKRLAQALQAARDMTWREIALLLHRQ